MINMLGSTRRKLWLIICTVKSVESNMIYEISPFKVIFILEN